MVGGSTTGAQKPMDKLLVPLTDVSINKVPYVTAKEAGLYTKHGLDVHLYITEGAAKKGEGDGMAPPKEFVGGKGSDLSTGGGVGLTVGKSQRGGDRVILATTDHDLRWHVYAKPEIKSDRAAEGEAPGRDRGLRAAPDSSDTSSPTSTAGRLVSETPARART